MGTATQLLVILLCTCTVSAQTYNCWYTTWYWYTRWCDDTTTPVPTTPSCAWQNWTECSTTCGPGGTRTRECKLGDTVVTTAEEECNEFCLNNGTLSSDVCLCPLDYTGTCCELEAQSDVELTHTTSGNEVLFQCNIVYDTSSQTSLHFEWFVGGNVVFEERLNGHSTMSTMSQVHWEGMMGSKIRCEVEISEAGSILGRKLSSSFFAGITVNAPDVIDVYENDDAVSFDLIPTVPFVCDDCQVQIPVSVAERNGRYGNYIDVVVGGECGVTMTTDKPNGPFAVSVKARRDFFRDGDGTVSLQFLPINSGEAKLWNGYQIPETISIRTHDRDRNSRKCSATGDPHFTSMDGTYFHIYIPGEFIYYQHSNLPYEVQTRQKPCARVACNCGVAARAEDDIIIVDRCKEITEQVVTFKNGVRNSYTRTYTKPVVKIIVNGEMTPGFRIIKENSGRKYTIHFPTGAYIQVEMWTWYHGSFVNVYYSPGADDFEKENFGFCGSFDSNRENDLLNGPINAPSKEYTPLASYNVVNDFAATWKVDQGKNLFYGEFDDTVSTETTTKVYCTCSPSGSNEVDARCDYGKDNGRPTSSTEGVCNSRSCDITDELLGQTLRRKRNSERSRRAVTNEDDDLSFEYDEDFVYEIPSWPTASGISEQRAKNECVVRLTESGPGKACQSALNETEIDEYVETCVIDIQVLDDLSVAKSAADLVKAQCEEVVTKNTDFWEGGSNGTFTPPASIIGALCPSDCNDNGNCVDGVCDCFDGYGSSDCSVNLNVAPTLYRSGESGLCDHSVDSCSQVSFYGDNFAEGDDLTCHVTPIKITASEFTLEVDVQELSGVFKTYEEVSCPIESSNRRRRNTAGPIEPVGVLVSISNDGGMESDQVLAIVYNANCDVCNGTEGTCYRRTDICIVDDDCYELTADECQGSSVNIGLIVGAVIGSTVAVLVIIIVTVFVCHKKKGKKKIGVENPDK